MAVSFLLSSPIRSYPERWMPYVSVDKYMHQLEWRTNGHFNLLCQRLQVKEKKSEKSHVQEQQPNSRDSSREMQHY